MWRDLSALLVVTAMGTIVVTPNVAVAQDESAASESDPATLFREGQEAYANGDQQTAYEKYLAAWKLKRSYDIAGNLGNVEVKLGKYAEAVPHLEFVLANLPVSMDSETRAAVMKRTQDLLNEAKSHVAVVKFSITPAEATIAVDGNPVEGRRLILQPGAHTLSLSAEGYQPVEQPLKVSAGSVENTVISMAKSGSGDSATISTSGDGADTASGGDDGPSIPILITGGVLGLGALGAGIGLHVVASGKGGERQDLIDGLSTDGACSSGSPPAECADIADLADQESTFSAAGTGLLIGGGVIVAATVTYWLWPRGSDGDDVAWQLVPTVGPSVNGLTLTGQF